MGSAEKSYGFTLIELLVVIAVLAVLAAGVFVTIDPAKQLGKSRDSRRKMDLATIRAALDRYAINNNGMFPPAGGCAYGSNCYVYSTAGSNWLPALVTSGELKNVPIDPKNNACCPWTTGNYSYSYGNVSADGQNFDLLAQLENTDDPERCGLKNYQFSWGGPWCTAFGGGYTNQLFERSPRNNN